MPNPFPGMNPYLEHPTFWPTFHYDFIYTMHSELNAVLPNGFRAATGSRLVIEYPRQHLIPDVAVLEKTSVPPVARPERGLTAVLDKIDAPDTLTVSPLKYKQGFIEILADGTEEKVVTMIELLSPANKRNGGGREEYLRKQEEMLESDVNLLEIDLLRAGLHTLAVPLEGARSHGNWNYLACLHRAANRYTYEFWRIGFNQRLPYLRVPLGADEPDVLLNTQAAFNRAFAEGRFDTILKYDAPPVPELEGDDAVWAENLLREKGLRGAN